jgi:hypothetical protein
VDNYSFSYKQLNVKNNNQKFLHALAVIGRLQATVSFFIIRSLKTFVGEHHSLRFHALPPFSCVGALRVACVAPMVFLSRYVPHWYLCLYTAGLAECVAFLIIHSINIQEFNIV